MNDFQVAPATLDFEALRTRYREERNRRLPNGDTARRSRDLADGFEQLLVDPYGRAPDRTAVNDEVDVLVVGGGFGGLLTAAQLREAGIERIRIIEAGGDVGGTWYWNRYPSAACDVESYIYFPLLEETGYMPTERYAKAPEIREHCVRIARHFDLYKHALFSTQVTSLDWDGITARWAVRTDRGDQIQARFVVLTTGPLNRPKLPDIPGIETFAGHTFHTSRWDYAYTGGSATAPMTKLSDKRVGIIGTGATAIQCVPQLARAAQNLAVFQRTPSSVDARNNAPTDPEWVKTLSPGWQQRRMENFTTQFTHALPAHDEVADGWTVLAAAVRAKIMADPAQMSRVGAVLEESDFEKMAEIRNRIDTIVEDPATADALKPWFSLYCKRPCFHDEYLQVFNRGNVTLVDTDGLGVERITAQGLVVKGQNYPLDCLIFATGFEVATSYAERSGMEIRGVGGQSLTEKWQDGLATYHGMHARGFPNMFAVSQAQAGMSPNFPHMLAEQTTHIAHIVGQCQTLGITTIEASEDAECNWVQTIVDMSEARHKFLAECTPGYYNNEGRISDADARAAPYGAGPIEFIKLLKAWREAGNMTGLEVDGPHARNNESEVA